MAAVTKAVKAATRMTATTRPRMTLILLEAHLLGRDAACPLCQRNQPSPPSLLDALQRAFGLDRNFRVGARRRTSDDAELLVTWGLSHETSTSLGSTSLPKPGTL